MDKTLLRKELLQKRLALSPEERAARDRLILKQVTALPELAAAKTILLYLDFRGEVDSEGLISWGIAAGKTVCAPVTMVQERRMIPVRLTSPHDVRLGAYNIREPIFAEDRVVRVEEIDAVILPGVGFDRNGGRLGYGGGYYDRFLPQLRADTWKVAVAYELQVLPEIPLEAHDILLDALVTECGVWWRTQV